jgi:hypothetical protein
MMHIFSNFLTHCSRGGTSIRTCDIADITPWHFSIKCCKSYQKRFKWCRDRIESLNKWKHYFYVKYAQNCIHFTIWLWIFNHFTSILTQYICNERCILSRCSTYPKCIVCWEQIVTKNSSRERWDIWNDRPQ